MPPQKYTAYSMVFDYQSPEQFSKIAVKQIVASLEGVLEVWCINPNTQQESVYKLNFVTTLGVFLIEDSGATYVVMVAAGDIVIRRAILTTASNTKFLITVNEFDYLCTAIYNNYLDRVQLVEIGRRNVSWYNL